MAGVVAICVPAAAATGALIAWRVSHPALPHASCGGVSTHLLQADTQVSTDAAPLTCFNAAAWGCEAASIRVREMGVDAGTNFVFTVEPGGQPCQVTELSQGYGFTGGGLSTDAIASTPCHVTAVTRKGVMLTCAGQAVLIPATASAPRPFVARLPPASCGSAVTHQLARYTRILHADSGTLPCFSAAVLACRSASIKIVDLGVGTEYLLTVEPGGTGCLVYQEGQAYSADSGNSTGPITGTSCFRTTRGRNGVMLGCMGHDVLIPATVAGSQR
jgi:hypothetical protein